MGQRRCPTFGVALRRQRLAARLTQEELAERAHLSVGAISALERGVNQLPQRDTLDLLVAALDLSPDDAAHLRALARRPPRGGPVAPEPATGGPGAAAPAEPAVGADETATAAHPDAAAPDLPRPLTSFIGRERELAELCDLLDQARLVTLTGPPGAGKTRLALEAALAMRERFAGPIAFVSLAALTDPDLVVPAVARALGVREAPGRPLLDVLSDRLRRRLLLVLDNFEQVLPAAPAVAALLAAAPSLTVLATSRALLRLYGERRFPVPPLALPDPADGTAAERLARAAAIRLFLERARAVQPDFALTPANAEAVAALCRRLDGLPLAIELAAARVRFLPPQALLARLEDRFALLADGPRDLPARQQTLRGAIDWSYALLPAAQQRLFRRLAVFAGGCTPEAAQAVCCWEEGAAAGALDALAALVDQSLLRSEERPAGEARFASLESVREYARERLAESGEAEHVQQRHAAYFLALAEDGDWAHAEDSPGRRRWLDRLEAEHDNLRAALRRHAERGEARQGLRLAGALGPFWASQHHWTEGRGWLASALARSDPIPTEAQGRRWRAAAQHWAGVLASAQGDYEAARALLAESTAAWRAVGDRRWLAATLNWLAQTAVQRREAAARPLVEEGLALSRELGDRAGIARCLHQLGALANYAGDHAAARRLLTEERQLREALGDRSGAAAATFQLGFAAMVAGDCDEARARFAESLAGYRALGMQRDVAAALNRLGELADQAGDHARAVALCTESLGYSRALDDWDGVAWSLKDLGRIARRQGDEQRAMALFRESLTLRRQQGHTWGMLACLAELAEGAALAGQDERAARLFAAAEALREAGGLLPSPGDLSGYDRADIDRHVAMLRARLGEPAFAAACKAGQAMTLDEAAADAMAQSDLPAAEQGIAEGAAP